MDFREVIVVEDDADTDGDLVCKDGAVVRVGNEGCDFGREEVVEFSDELRNEMPLAVVPPESGMAVFPRRGNRTPGVVIQNPEWLPSGWLTEMKIRKSGSSAGHMDKYYFEIATGKKCRSKLEVFRYIETGLSTGDRPELPSLPDAPAPALSSPPCCKPTYYYQPVLCESPVYADHPGLFPVVYFPVIGESPEDQFKPPPMGILTNMQLKPILSRRACSVPPPPDCRQHHLGNAQDRLEKNKKPRIVSGLAESDAAVDLNSPPAWDGKYCSNYPVSNSASHPTSLTMSCNKSHYRVTVPPSVLSHIQCNPNYNPCQGQVVMPCQNQNSVFKARSNASNPVRMRGHLSEARLLALKKDLKL